jgi:predicted dehydrogenase
VTNDKLRVGVIGVGHMGEYHLQKYRSIPKVEIVGVADTNHERLTDIRKRYNVKIYKNYHELLSEVDAVSLAVPTTEHFDVAKEILTKGIHLLIEKPISYKLKPAETLLEMAHERNLIFQVGLVERFNPAILKMESLVNNPIFIESHRLNKFTPRGTDVDVVFDLMIHDLDIILHAVQSEVREIHSVGMSVVTGMTDIANVRLIFENDTVANLTVSRVSTKTLRKIRVFQSDLYMDVNYVKKVLKMIRIENGKGDMESLAQIEPEVEEFPDRDPLTDQITSFVDSVMNGSEPVVTGQDGLKALKITLEIINQIRMGPNHFKVVR